jgi:putative ABC transport system substrate-binding protein
MIRRRQFITLLGGAALGRPIAARAEPAGIRRLGVLVGFAKDDLVRQPWVAGFVTTLANLGWTDGRNIRIDYRWVNAEQGGMSAYLAAAGELHSTSRMQNRRKAVIGG